MRPITSARGHASPRTSESEARHRRKFAAGVGPRRQWKKVGRCCLLPSLFARCVGAAVLVVLIALAVPAAAQETRSVRLRTLGPGDILYVLIGGGGNTLALMRDDGVVVIDTKLPGWGAPIREAIEAATDQPVATIINTHAHPDHAGGNKEFPGKVEIVAHANAAAAAGATPHGHRQADAAQRPRSDRPLLLRPRPHERRSRRGVSAEASRLPRRSLSVEIGADRRRRRGRERGRAGRHAPPRRDRDQGCDAGRDRPCRRAGGHARPGGHLGRHLDAADDAVERRRGVRRLHARLRRRRAPGEARRARHRPKPLPACRCPIAIATTTCGNALAAVLAIYREDAR